MRLLANSEPSPTSLTAYLNGSTYVRLRDRAILYLSTNEIRGIEAELDEQAPLLGAAATLAWQGLTLDNLLARAEAILAAREHGEALSEPDLAFLRLITAILNGGGQWLRGSTDFASPWTTSGCASNDIEVLERPRHFFSDDGSIVMLLARPAQPNRQSFTPMAESGAQARRGGPRPATFSRSSIRTDRAAGSRTR